MDIEARRMNGRARAVIVIALAIFSLSWAVGGRTGCASGSACATPALDGQSPHRPKSAIIGATVHIVDPNAPHELATAEPATSAN